MEEKNVGGRPLLYKTAQELQEKIDEYINACSEDVEHIVPLTYTGLAYHLGFASRQSIWEYSKRTDELSLPIKRAMLRIEQSYEEGLRSNNATGSIFALKNRGWSDKREVENKITRTVENLTDEELDEEIETLNT